MSSIRKEGERNVWLIFISQTLTGGSETKDVCAILSFFKNNDGQFFFLHGHIIFINIVVSTPPVTQSYGNIAIEI